MARLGEAEVRTAAWEARTTPFDLLEGNIGNVELTNGADSPSIAVCARCCATRGLCSLHPLDAAIAVGRCLVLRFREWLAGHVMSDLRAAYQHALGLPAQIREHTNPQALIFTLLIVEAGDTHIGIACATHGRTLVEACVPPSI